MAADDPDLARILRLAEGIVPGMKGRQAAIERNSHEQSCDQETMHTLYRNWVSSYPEAGNYYAALRAWVMMIWQPIYLSVIASHLDTHVPRLTGMRQAIVNGSVEAFILPVHEPHAGELAARIDFACAELDEFCGSVRRTLKRVATLHDRAMNCLQAECVLAALLAIHRMRSPAGDGSVEFPFGFGKIWLKQLAISEGCGYFSYPAGNGEERLALDRRVCCHHFRRHDGVKCATCPKFPIETRIRRLLKEDSRT